MQHSLSALSESSQLRIALPTVGQRMLKPLALENVLENGGSEILKESLKARWRERLNI